MHRYVFHAGRGSCDGGEGSPFSKYMSEKIRGLVQKERKVFSGRHDVAVITRWDKDKICWNKARHKAQLSRLTEDSAMRRESHNGEIDTAIHTDLSKPAHLCQSMLVAPRSLVLEQFKQVVYLGHLLY